MKHSFSFPRANYRLLDAAGSIPKTSWKPMRPKDSSRLARNSVLAASIVGSMLAITAQPKADSTYISQLALQQVESRVRAELAPHQSSSPFSNVSTASTPLIGSIQEADEIIADNSWRTVTFRQSFADPVVIAEPRTYYDGQSSAIAIRNVDANGFEIRTLKCGSPDESDIPQAVHYFVVERGHYTLMDGTEIEARQKFQWGECDSNISGG